MCSLTQQVIVSEHCRGRVVYFCSLFSCFQKKAFAALYVIVEEVLNYKYLGFKTRNFPLTLFFSLCSSQYSPVRDHRWCRSPVLLLVPCVDTVLSHQHILPEEHHSALNVKNPKRLLRILWKCWWLDPIW